jgi:hypothetical protein
MNALCPDGGVVARLAPAHKGDVVIRSKTSQLILGFVVYATGLVVGLVGAGESTPDLKKVAREIKTLPKLKCDKPLYALYIFGEKASHSAWAILDKTTEDQREYDVLYFDRQFNGDLSVPTNKIMGKLHSDPQKGIDLSLMVGEMFFEIGTLREPGTVILHTDVSISRGSTESGSLFRMRWNGKTVVRGGYPIMPGSNTAFGTSPANAPVLWVTTTGLLSCQPWNLLRLIIGSEDDLAVMIGHEGLGRATFCALETTYLKKNTPINATLIYLDSRGRKQSVTWQLLQRCCDLLHHGTIRVPAGAQPGTATLQLQVSQEAGLRTRVTEWQVQLVAQP